MKEVPCQERLGSMDLSEWMPSDYHYREGVLKTQQQPELFLERLAWLQELAAFMAKTDT